MSPRTRPRLARDERPDSASGLRRYFRLDVVLTVVAVAALLLVAVRLVDEPKRIATLTIANPSEYTVAVAVAGGSRHGWLALPAVVESTTRQYQDVLDQGDTWVFSFRAQGRDGGEITISRADLAERGWNLDVPDVVIKRFREAAAPPNRRP